jgi:uncharacterized protein (TIGR02996 family)
LVTCDIRQTNLELAVETERQAFLNAMIEEPLDEAVKKSYADWLEENGEADEAALYRSWSNSSILPDIDSYDWREAFAYASDSDITPSQPGSNIATTGFSECSVRRIIGIREGANEGPNWVCVGELWDGRWFALDAGCDYTGWG